MCIGISINKKFKKKSQVVVLTIFMIFISLAIVESIFLPINQQVIILRKLINSFQALTYSETGLEYSLFHVFNEETNFNYHNFNFSTSSGSFINSVCEDFANKYKIQQRYGISLSDIAPSLTCDNISIKNSISTINVDVHVTVIATGTTYSNFGQFVSEGKFQNLRRVLFYDFF